jgi:hypothetical protein
MKLIRVKIAELLDEQELPRRVGTRSEGERVRPAVLNQVSQSPAPLVVIDLTGVEIVNSSFSDEIIAVPLLRISSGEYGERYLVVVTPTREVIQDAQSPLEKRDLTLIVFVGELGKDWYLLGTQKSFFEETLGAIIRSRSASTGELAKLLGISLQNCSNRLTELAKRRLVQREREFGVRGGQTHANRSLLDIAE